MVFIYITCRDAEEAKKLGKIIIEDHLAACINIWPVESMYIWKEKLTEEKEAVLLVKTSEARVQDIEDLIHKHHTYSIPLVGTVDLRRINRAYKEWASQIIR